MNHQGEYKELTEEKITLLKKPLPDEAVDPHPTKSYLSTIKVIYMIERLNDVFGIGGWTLRCQVVENPPDRDMVVVETTLTIPDYGIQLSSYGGNDNKDRGDAYKGAVTDAISKICSWLGIGMDVYKGKVKTGMKKEVKGDKLVEEAINILGGEKVEKAPGKAFIK